MKQNGILEEHHKPYSGRYKNNNCETGQSRSNKKYLHSIVEDYSYFNKNEMDMLVELMINYSPIIIYINANPLQYHTNGLLDCIGSSDTINHAVTIIGFGKNEEYGEYWIVRNSWGEYAHGNGYFKMRFNHNDCNLIKYNPMLPIVKSCKISEWSSWSDNKLDLSTQCTYKSRSRYIISNPTEVTCPSNLLETKVVHSNENSCSSHGSCINDLYTNTISCNCNTNYATHNCSIECPKVLDKEDSKSFKICNNHGLCNDTNLGDGTCICNSGYIGKACQYSNHETCNNRGIPNFNGTCNCTFPYKGSYCQYSRNLTCNGNGETTYEGKCICDLSYDGESCQYSRDITCNEMEKLLMKENVYVIYLMMGNIVNIQIMKHVMEMV